MKKTLTHDSKRQGHSLGLTQQAQTRHSCLLHLSTLRFLPSFVLLFLLALLPSLSYAYTYSTIADGNWSSPKTWRGGIMPKSYIKADDVVYIRHNVVYNLPKDLIVKGKVNLERGVVCKNSVGRILSRSFFVEKKYIQNDKIKEGQIAPPPTVGAPCNASRWNDGGSWTGVGCGVNDGNSANGGIVRCANSADTQSGIDDNTTYQPSAFTITPSGCINPNNLAPVTITPPFTGQKIAWFNFDVRPYAGTYDFQTIATGSYDLEWALYYSTAETCGLTGGLSGDCSQLSGVIACGTNFTGWSPQPFITPVFDKATNLYLVVWKKGATSSSNDDFDFTFKARYGCGDFCSVFLNGSPTVTCNPDGSYKVVQSLNGSSTTVTVSAPGSTSIVTNPSPLTFTAADAIPSVNTGTVKHRAARVRLDT